MPRAAKLPPASTNKTSNSTRISLTRPLLDLSEVDGGSENGALPCACWGKGCCEGGPQPGCDTGFCVGREGCENASWENPGCDTGLAYGWKPGCDTGFKDGCKPGCDGE